MFARVLRHPHSTCWVPKSGSEPCAWYRRPLGHGLSRIWSALGLPRYSGGRERPLFVARFAACEQHGRMKGTVERTAHVSNLGKCLAVLCGATTNNRAMRHYTLSAHRRRVRCGKTAIVIVCRPPLLALARGIDRPVRFADITPAQGPTFVVLVTHTMHIGPGAF